VRAYKFQGIPLTPLEVELIMDELKAGPTRHRVDFLVWVLEASLKKYRRRSMRIVK
jgi:hypothetical protein